MTETTKKTETTATAKSAPVKKRKPAVKRDFTELGKFFAIVRIELGLTTEQWAKALGVSTLAVTNVERGGNRMSFEYASKATEVVADKAPKYSGELAAFIADQLGVIFIPKKASPEAIEQAFLTLHHYDSQAKQAE